MSFNDAESLAVLLVCSVFVVIAVIGGFLVTECGRRKSEKLDLYFFISFAKSGSFIVTV